VLAAALVPLLLAALAWPAPAAAACPPRAARVRVAVVERPLLIEHRQSITALHAEAGERRLGRGQHLALTTSRVEWHSELNAHVSRLAQPREALCAVPAEVVLTLVEAEHRISIANDIPAGSCLYREVLAHERRHAAVNRRSLAVAASRARADASAWAARARAQAADADAALARLQAGLKRAIAPSLAAMRQARAAAHAQIDTGAEYRRLATVCGDDQRRLAARLRAITSD
jgi:hypothetical protein